jgi:hypothetical protein
MLALARVLTQVNVCELRGFNSKETWSVVTKSGQADAVFAKAVE